MTDRVIAPARVAAIVEALQAGISIRAGDTLRMRLRLRFRPFSRRRLTAGTYRRFVVTPALLAVATARVRNIRCAEWLTRDSLTVLHNQLALSSLVYRHR